MKKVILTTLATIFAAPAVSFAATCSNTLAASLLADAQALEAGTKTTSAVYENNDQGVNRLRQLVLFAGTSSFAEYFERNGVMSKIYFIENSDGTYRSAHTNNDVDAITFCNTDFQDESVTWKSGGLPVIDIEIVCGDDKSIISEGVIEYFSNGLEVRGGPWKKNGSNTTCAGATEIGVSVYK